MAAREMPLKEGVRAEPTEGNGQDWADENRSYARRRIYVGQERAPRQGRSGGRASEEVGVSCRDRCNVQDTDVREQTKEKYDD